VPLIPTVIAQGDITFKTASSNRMLAYHRTDGNMAEYGILPL